MVRNTLPFPCGSHQAAAVSSGPQEVADLLPCLEPAAAVRLFLLGAWHPRSSSPTTDALTAWCDPASPLSQWDPNATSAVSGSGCENPAPLRPRTGQHLAEPQRGRSLPRPEQCPAPLPLGHGSRPPAAGPSWGPALLSIINDAEIRISCNFTLLQIDALKDFSSQLRLEKPFSAPGQTATGRGGVGLCPPRCGQLKQSSGRWQWGAINEMKQMCPWWFSWPLRVDLSCGQHSVVLGKGLEKPSEMRTRAINPSQALAAQEETGKRA
ncbi:PREDICTED: uncharacterized protein LOC102010856 [Chinchilla lanigera]|uniref:uncharacterized protein LOC102010856 n=1 Tax=Chinchilla lanigera TaxID=34839 RepID=UPI00038EE0AE|nr:PREDICTED: uncharacterized protein LOC102010856 [Chinchilla lanigera]